MDLHHQTPLTTTSASANADGGAVLDNPADIELSKPSKSRFLFLLAFFGLGVFAWASCYNVWEHRFQKNDDVEIPDHTALDPKYK